MKTKYAEKSRSSTQYLIIAHGIGVYIFFHLFFYLGVYISKLIYTLLFGNPYGIGWLLIEAVGIPLALLLGFIGSLLGSIGGWFLLKDRIKLSGLKFYQYIGIPYLIFIILIIVEIIVVNKFIPNCPNCVP